MIKYSRIEYSIQFEISLYGMALISFIFHLPGANILIIFIKYRNVNKRLVKFVELIIISYIIKFVIIFFLMTPS